MSHLSKSCRESARVVPISEEEEEGDSLAAGIFGRSSKADSASEIAPLGRSCESFYHQSLRIKGVTLHYCTEGLGSESSDDQDENTASWDSQEESISDRRVHGEESWRKIEESAEWRAVNNEVRSSDHSAAPVNAGHDERLESVDEEELVETPKYNGKFPPAISSIAARGGSPHRPLDSQSTFLRSYKRDGRFLLQEVKVPCQNFLRASRKDGRLKLQLYNYSDSPNLEEESAKRELDLCSDEKMEILQPTCKIESGVDLEQFTENESESNNPGVHMSGRNSMEECVSEVSDGDEAHVTPACSTDGTSSTGRVVQNVMAAQLEESTKIELEESSGAMKEGSCEARETEIRELNCMSTQIRVMEKQDRYPCFSQTYDTAKMSSIEQRSFMEYYDSSMIPVPVVAVC